MDAIDKKILYLKVRSILKITEKQLRQRRFQRKPLTDNEVNTALIQKAFYLGREHNDIDNPFHTINHPVAAQIAASFTSGQMKYGEAV